MKKILYIKIIIIIIITFISVQILSDEVFYSKSPRINPQFISFLKSVPVTLVSLPSRFLRMIQKTGYDVANLEKIPGKNELYIPRKPGVPSGKIDAVLKEIPLQKVSKGIYAGEHNTYDVTVEKIDENSRWVWTDYKLHDGKTIKLLVPEK